MAKRSVHYDFPVFMQEYFTTYQIYLLLIHSHTAPKRALCGADVQHRTRDAKLPAKPLFGAPVGRREPYNLTLESKTYYTQNYDTMR